MQYTDQNPGIHLAFVFLWFWRDQARRCIPGCYRTVPYQTQSTPVIHSHHSRSTRYHTNTPGPNPHGVPVSLSSLSLSPSPRPFIIAGFSSFPVPLLFLFSFFFFPFLFSPSYHRVFSQLCPDIDRLFPFFWPPQPVFGVLSHGRRQTVRRLWPPESLLRFLAIVPYLLLSTLLRLDLIESSSSWCF